MRLYTLIEKSQFDSLAPQIKKEIVNASNSNESSNFPVTNLSGKDWYIIEAEKDRALNTILTEYELFEINKFKSILSSGAYNPEQNKTTKDSDGATLIRTKISQSGWTYHLHGIQFETSNLSSVVNKDINNADLGYTTIACNKSDGGSGFLSCENQADADLNCIQTIIDWEPDYDYEVLGGDFTTISSPITDMYVYCVGVPDIPKVSGGSKDFVNGINARCINPIAINGEAPKKLKYDAELHTNKLRITINHNAGVKHKFFITIKLFKN